MSNQFTENAPAAMPGDPAERHVRVLPDAVINKIAAGEVVERPASVLRELLDNALDAGAKHVRVEILDGGRRLVRVTDDGCGMGREDALMSIERHATSKLRDFSDLDTLSTMGFRGEALAAISSVSQFTLTTQREDSDAGTEVVVFGGRIQEIRDAGVPPGTDIAVRNLFFNVPARRKFLRSAQTEFTHIRQQFFLSALTRPDVEFTLLAEDEEVCRLPAASDLRERVRDFHGDAVADALRPVSYGDGVTEVGGWAGAPPFSRRDRELQVALINGRAAWSPILGYAVQTAYRDILPGGHYAPLFLTIDLPKTLVDVNVHPAKKEVRFRRPTEVRDVLVEAIREAVRGNDGISGRKYRVGAGGAPAPQPAAATPVAPVAPSTAPVPSVPVVPEKPAAVPPPLPPLPQEPPVQAAPAPFALSPAAPQVRPVQGDLDLAPGKPVGTAAAGSAAAPAAAPRPAPWDEYRLLGRLACGYWVMEIPDGMVLLDPSSAHERVLFEKWMASIRGGSVPRQGLLPPAMVTLSPLQSNALRHSLKYLADYGYAVSEFGRDAWLLEALPAWVSGEEPSAALSDLADWLLQHGRTPSAAPDWLPSLVAGAVARHALRLRAAQDEDAVRALVADLSRTEMPYASPRGKPTMILSPWRELHRKFGREG